MLTIRISRRVAFLVVLGVFLAIPAGSWASHRFVDVPDSNIFHTDIGWLADAGVTLGCNPPANDEFCPSDVVTRSQMSAFMRRLARYLDAEDGSPGFADTAGDTNTLDGLDSTAFRRTGDGSRAFSIGGGQSQNIESTDETVRVTFFDPPSDGTVIVNSTVNVAEGTAGDGVECSINDDATIDPAFVQRWESAGPNGSEAQLAGTRSFTVFSGSRLVIRLVCRHFGSSALALIEDSTMTGMFFPDQ